jgi:hypothetical protein
VVPEVNNSTLARHVVGASDTSSDAVLESRFTLTRSDSHVSGSIRVEEALTESSRLFVVVATRSNVTPTAHVLTDIDIFKQS